MAISTKSVLIALGAASAMLAACTPQVPTAIAAVNDKVYTVTPDAMQVKAGIVIGEVTDMKVIEGVEEGTGRVAAPAKLTGKLSLKNTSKDQTMRLVGAKIRYIDMQGKPIALEDNRTEPTIQTPGSRAGFEPRAGRRVSGCGAKGEEPERSAPRARVHPIAVSRGDAHLRCFDRRPVKPRGRVARPASQA